MQVSREIRRQLVAAPKKEATRKHTFAGDNKAWEVWKAYRDRLRDQLRAPIDRWMATRLVRLFPVVLALYEKVKVRRRQLDQLDLLVKLRNLLARDKKARGDYQRMFDHIFVDEFQDTHPLQAEIVLYLCEREPRADRWTDVILSDGKLTLVGDPKQSIYRFRRADVAMYDSVRRLVAGGDHLEVKLSANFRSVPPLIEWFNDCFARILGTSRDGRPFDPDSGRVYQQRLDSGREGKAEPAVWILPFEFSDGETHNVGEYRRLEGRVLARDLRRRRFDRTPGATARDLLDRTAFARSVALMPNGAQRITRLRELCLVLERIAAREGLDYDSVSGRMREWVGRPIQLGSAAPGRGGSRRGDDGSPGKRARIPGGCDLGREGPVEHSPGERCLADGTRWLRLDASSTRLSLPGG